MCLNIGQMTQTTHCNALYVGHISQFKTAKQHPVNHQFLLTHKLDQGMTEEGIYGGKSKCWVHVMI